jgi:hypothetical protein
VVPPHLLLTPARVQDEFRPTHAGSQQPGRVQRGETLPAAT